MKILSVETSLVCILILMASCFTQKKNAEEGSKPVDDFYKRDVGWDYARIPLIKPYEMLRLKGQKQWNMNLHTLTLDHSIGNIKEVNIINNTIVVHASGGTYLRGDEVPEAWFVIIPEKQIETGFAQKEEFLAYLAKLGINDPKFYPADQVFASFQKKYPIDWQADFR